MYTSLGAKILNTFRTCATLIGVQLNMYTEIRKNVKILHYEHSRLAFEAMYQNQNESRLETNITVMLLLESRWGN